MTMSARATYISTMREFPSRKAHSIQIMNMSSAFAKQGWALELMLPRLKTASLNGFAMNKSVWDFYGISENFKITPLPAPFFDSRGGYAFYKMLAMSYAAYRKTHICFSRDMEVAYLAGLSGRVSIYESHNYSNISRKKALRPWLKMIKNSKHQVAMVVTTQAGADAYQRLGVPVEKLLVARNGVNLHKFTLPITKADARSRLGLLSFQTIVGYCGHMYEGKGIEALIGAAQFLPNVFFLIVGGYPNDVERCRSLAQELRLSNITFTGFVPPDSVPTYLLASDILAMPYTTDTGHDYRSPMKLFDYMASGRPIVATDFPVFREILRDKHNAVLVPPDSSETLAAGIRWLLNNPEQAEKLGQQARQDVQEYSWETRARRIVSWCTELFTI